MESQQIQVALCLTDELQNQLKHVEHVPRHCPLCSMIAQVENLRAKLLAYKADMPVK